jgi:hypothetical protein
MVSLAAVVDQVQVQVEETAEECLLQVHLAATLVRVLRLVEEAVAVDKVEDLITSHMLEEALVVLVAQRRLKFT